MNIDCHFHPNFLFRLPGNPGVKAKAKAIRKAFKKHKLDAVIITEHVFKRPARSFRTLLKYKPKNATTHILPGVEALTKEGIDLLVYCKDTYIYSCKELMTPGLMNFQEMYEYINNDPELIGVVTHPFILSNTALINHFPEEYIYKAAKTLCYIEKHNCSFIWLDEMLKNNSLLQRIVGKKRVKRIRNIVNLDHKHYPASTNIVGGSDAHHPEELGDFMHFETQETNPRLVLTNPSIIRQLHSKKRRTRIPLFLIRNFITIMIERILKTIRIYTSN